MIRCDSLALSMLQRSGVLTANLRKSLGEGTRSSVVVCCDGENTVMLNCGSFWKRELCQRDCVRNIVSEGFSVVVRVSNGEGNGVGRAVAAGVHNHRTSVRPNERCRTAKRGMLADSAMRRHLTSACYASKPGLGSEVHPFVRASDRKSVV